MDIAIAWSDLLRALALVLIIEGLWPFLAPASLRRVVQQLGQVDDRVLRTIGLVATIAGILMLQLK